MATYAPFIEKIKIYRRATFSYQFNFDENGSALDLTTLSDIKVVFSEPGNQVFKHTISGGGLTISGGSNNELTGEASASTMDIAKRTYDLIIRFIFADGSENVYVDFDAEIVEGQNQTAHEWNVDISTDAETVSGEQLTGLTARAIQAKDDAETAESNAQTSETNAATSETNAASSASAAATSETNAAASETESQDNADDAEKQAQNTTSFTDSDGNSFTKGAQGYANDAQTSANNASADAEQQAVDAHGWLSKELSNIKKRLRDLES